MLVALLTAIATSAKHDSLTKGNALFIYTAAIHLLIAGFVAWRTTQRAPVPEEEKGEFKDALVAAQVFAPIQDLIAPAAIADHSEAAYEPDNCAAR